MYTYSQAETIVKEKNNIWKEWEEDWKKKNESSFSNKPHYDIYDEMFQSTDLTNHHYIRMKDDKWHYSPSRIGDRVCMLPPGILSISPDMIPEEAYIDNELLEQLIWVVDGIQDNYDW